jgi:hypothetical protein
LDDRKLAEEQKFCAIENDNRLGSMGTPVKVMVKDQPVFLCCKGCQKKALSDRTRRWPKPTNLDPTLWTQREDQFRPPAYARRS